MSISPRNKKNLIRNLLIRHVYLIGPDFGWLSNDIYRNGGIKVNKANNHLWRHEKAQDLAREGKSDKEIAEYLGHCREGVTKHYK